MNPGYKEVSEHLSKFIKTGGQVSALFDQSEIIMRAGEKVHDEDKNGICALACAAWIVHGCPNTPEKVRELSVAISENYIQIGSVNSAIIGATKENGFPPKEVTCYDSEGALNLLNLANGVGNDYKRLTIGKIGVMAQGVHSIGFSWQQLDNSNSTLKLFDPNEGVFSISGENTVVGYAMGDLLLDYLIPRNFPDQTLGADEKIGKTPQYDELLKGHIRIGGDTYIADDTKALQYLLDQISVKYRRWLLTKGSEAKSIEKTIDPFAVNDEKKELKEKQLPKGAQTKEAYDPFVGSSEAYSPSHPSDDGLPKLIQQAKLFASAEPKTSEEYDPNSPISTDDEKEELKGKLPQQPYNPNSPTTSDDNGDSIKNSAQRRPRSERSSSGGGDKSPEPIKTTPGLVSQIKALKDELEELNNLISLAPISDAALLVDWQDTYKFALSRKTEIEKQLAELEEQVKQAPSFIMKAEGEKKDDREPSPDGGAPAILSSNQTSSPNSNSENLYSSGSSNSGESTQPWLPRHLQEQANLQGVRMIKKTFIDKFDGLCKSMDTEAVSHLKKALSESSDFQNEKSLDHMLKYIEEVKNKLSEERQEKLHGETDEVSSCKI